MTEETLPLEPPAPATNAASGDVATAGDQDAAAPLAGPRTRWAAIVWGFVFAGLSLAGVAYAADPASPTEFVAWAQRIDVGAAVAYGLLVVGAMLLIVGLVGLLRRAQRALGRRAS